jgi:hypothetical protein
MLSQNKKNFAELFKMRVSAMIQASSHTGKTVNANLPAENSSLPSLEFLLLKAA